MDAVLFGRYFLEFALLYPGAYLCLAPLRDHLKAPKTTYWIAGGALTALCLPNPTTIPPSRATRTSTTATG